jgi:hypothetical protein
MTANDVSLRAFLTQTGVLGACAVLLPPCAGRGGGPGAGPGATGGVAAALGLDAFVELLRPVLAQLSRDTLNGFIAFNLPGQDAYSRAQGTPRGEPGGIEAGGTASFIENLDRFLPFPDASVRPAASALVTALHHLPLPPLPLLPGLLDPLNVTLGLVEDAMFFILQHDDAAPLSLPVALLLNYVATVVNPLSVTGAFLSPFSRLSFADKGRTLAMIETSQSSLVALVDAQVPPPLKASVSGLLTFLGSALYEFAAFGSVGKSRQGNPQTRSLTEPPGGWQLGSSLPDN